MIRPFVLAYLLLSLLAVASQAQWIKQSVNTTASFRGLSVVNEKVIWASGTGGTVIRTIGGGKKWDVITVPGAEKLDFRDIEAFDANTAYILSIGNDESSRIYKTTDGGKTWRLEFQNDDSKAFYDAIACWDADHCIAMSDPVDGGFLIILRSPAWQSSVSRKVTSWKRSIYRTPAESGEAAFAASGTCLITLGKHSPISVDRGIAPNEAFIVTGGNAARVLHTMDSGLSWSAATTSIVKGTTGSGIFSIAMYDDKNGIIVGGNYEKPDEHANNLAFTTDSGKRWKLGTGLSGFRSGVTYVDKNTILAVGTNGSDITRDGGKTWKRLGDENLNAVQATGKLAVWAVGPKGLVVKMK